MFCLCSLKRKKSFNVFTVVLIFPQAINVLSSQDVGPSVKSWPDSCYVPHWWGPWLKRKRSMMPYYGSSKGVDASKAFEVGVNEIISAIFYLSF